MLYEKINVSPVVTLTSLTQTTIKIHCICYPFLAEEIELCILCDQECACIQAVLSELQGSQQERVFQEIAP